MSHEDYRNLGGEEAGPYRDLVWKGMGADNLRRLEEAARIDPSLQLLRDMFEVICTGRLALPAENE